MTSAPLYRIASMRFEGRKLTIVLRTQGARRAKRFANKRSLHSLIFEEDSALQKVEPRGYWR